MPGCDIHNSTVMKPKSVNKDYDNDNNRNCKLLTDIDVKNGRNMKILPGKIFEKRTIINQNNRNDTMKCSKLMDNYNEKTTNKNISNKNNPAKTSIENSSSASSLPPPPPTPPPIPLSSSPSTIITAVEREQEQQIKSSSDGTKISSNSVSVSTTTASKTTKSSQQQQKQQQNQHQNKNQKQAQVCTSCSSYDLTEINIKLKTCQNCNNIIIDDLDYNSTHLLNGETNNLLGTASGSNNGNTNSNQISSYYHQLSVITKKLKNAYKSRVQSQSQDDQQKSNSSSIDIMPILNGLENQKSVSPIQSHDPIITSKTSSSAIASTTERNRDHYHHPHHSNLHHECPNNKKSNSNTTNKSIPININHGKGNKDVLILRICDLDDKKQQQQQKFYKLKAKNIEGGRSTSISPISETSSSISRYTTTANDINTGISSKKLEQQKLVNTGMKLKSPQSITTTPINAITQQQPSPVQEIVVISDEYKKNSEKILADIHVKNHRQRRRNYCSNLRRNSNHVNSGINTNKSKKIKRQKRDSTLSKSLDIIHSDNISYFDDNFLYAIHDTDQDKIDHQQQQHQQSASTCMFTSKSVSNLIENYYSDDDGPFESINSVELIFISDEFLNKAIKHDLKILKNKKVDATAQSTTVMSSSSSSNKSRKMKTKNLQITQSNNLKIDTNRSPTASIASDKESLSPISPTPTIATTTTSSNNKTTTSTQSSKMVSKSYKKLIVISEDFKRKSLENNVVIVNESSSNMNNQNSSTNVSPIPAAATATTTVSITTPTDVSPTTIITAAKISVSTTESENENSVTVCTSDAKQRKNLKQIQQLQQQQQQKHSQHHRPLQLQTSIDDVGNQMTSHAFCSIEEPDEQCLESKEIQTPD